MRRGLLIVPAALKPQWVREWQATTDIAITSVDGSPESRTRIYRQPKTPFLVIGYEQLLKDLSLVHEFAPDVVVLDEAQRIKNYATKTAVYVKSLTPSYRLVLTGTPMENRLEELASVLDWVDDIALTPKWRLEPWHTFREGDGGAGRTGARNLDTLRARMAPCMLRRIRREVLSQLPSRTDTRVPVPMTPEQQSEQDELIQPIATLIATGQHWLTRFSDRAQDALVGQPLHGSPALRSDSCVRGTVAHRRERTLPRNSCQPRDDGWDESCAFYSTTGPSSWPKHPT